MVYEVKGKTIYDLPQKLKEWDMYFQKQDLKYNEFNVKVHERYLNDNKEYILRQENNFLFFI